MSATNELRESAEHDAPGTSGERPSLQQPQEPQAGAPTNGASHQHAMSRLGETLKTPAGSATVAAAIVFGVASTFGLFQAVVGAGAAYGVYLAIRRNDSHG